MNTTESVPAPPRIYVKMIMSKTYPNFLMICFQIISLSDNQFYIFVYCNVTYDSVKEVLLSPVTISIIEP